MVLVSVWAENNSGRKSIPFLFVRFPSPSPLLVIVTEMLYCRFVLTITFVVPRAVAVTHAVPSATSYGGGDHTDVKPGGRLPATGSQPSGKNVSGSGPSSG